MDQKLINNLRDLANHPAVHKAIVTGWKPVYVNPNWDEAATYVNGLFQKFSVVCGRVNEKEFELIKAGLRAIQRPHMFERSEDGLCRVKAQYKNYSF